MRARLSVLAVLGVFLWVAGARAEERPILQLDTGGHQALVESLAFTPDGKFIVSAGDDKVVRIWDWRAGQTVRTIRGQSGPGPEGTIYSMALSPDGRWLAVGGRMHPECEGRCGEIRLYDFATGELKALLKGHTNLVQSLAFSSDSKRLISGMSNSDAVAWDVNSDAIIWDVEAKQLLHRLRGHRDDVNAVDLTPDGARAVTASVDKMVRLWRVDDGSLVKEMAGHADIVRSLAVSPKDGSIVSGDKTGEIRLWDGKTGDFLRVFASQDNDIGSLRFSPDGSLLLSTSGRSSKPQRIYDAATGKELTSYTKHGNVVIAGAFSPDGSLVATAGGALNEIHVWSPTTGETKAVLKGTGQPVWAVGFSEDGRSIAWGTTPDYRGHNNRGPLEMALRLPAAGQVLLQPEPVKSAQGWVRAKESFGVLSLQHRKGGACGGEGILDILKDGKPEGISIERDSLDGCEHQSYSFAPDGTSVISGGDTGNLTAYSLDAKKIGDFVGHDGDIWSVAPSPDGTYLLSGSLDQTVRLWNLKTSELLVTLFQDSNGEWVMWTPQGYYAASGPGSEMIGWQINRSAEHEAEYVTAAQLRKSLNRPDIVTRAIQLASAEAAVKEANGTNFKLADLLAKPVPRLRIVSPAQNATLHGGSVQLEIALEATPDPVKSIRIQVNGRQIAEHHPEQGGGFVPGPLTFTVPLEAGRNTIRVVASNDTGETSAEVVVTHDGKGALNKLGTLYILAIGVDKYPKLGMACREVDEITPKACDLDVAGADAKVFAKTMAERLGPLHVNVVPRVLVNGAAIEDTPTAANILDALGELLRQSTPNDTILLFVSGHGFNEGQSYRFLATDAAFSGGALRNSTVVPWVNFQETIEAVKGRRILFLDTCHSGNSYNQRLGNDSYAANIIVYSAARWDQEALERSDLGHGLFTYAVVEGVNGAAKNPTGEVKTESLRDFLGRRVPEMAKALKRDREPQYFRGRDAQDYLLAVEK